LVECKDGCISFKSIREKMATRQKRV